MKLTASPVKRFALEHDLKVAQPTSLRRNGKYPQEASAAIDLLRATPHDVMVVAAYGLILPQEVLDIAPHGSINIHGSLLPRWRGAAPIHRAIEAGDAETGITLMQMDAGLDTGAMIREARVPILPDDTTGSLHDRLAQLGADLIVQALRDLERDGALPSTPQPDEGATYAEKIAKHEAALDWRRPADALARQVRAFDPFPGAFGTLDGVAVKIWAAGVSGAAPAAKPGTIVDGFDGRRGRRVRRRCAAAHAIAEAGRQAPAGARIPRRREFRNRPAFRDPRIGGQSVGQPQGFCMKPVVTPQAVRPRLQALESKTQNNESPGVLRCSALPVSRSFSSRSSC